MGISELRGIAYGPLRVSQVFANLVDNAIKYMPERVPREIRVSCEEGEKTYLFSVTDSGNGIDLDLRQQVFRPFKRLDAKNSPAGEGLGLAAVRKVVELHGGSIWFDDAPSGQGASFRFTWPRPVDDGAVALDAAWRFGDFPSRRRRVPRRLLYWSRCPPQRGTSRQYARYASPKRRSSSGSSRQTTYRCAIAHSAAAYTSSATEPNRIASPRTATT